MEIKDIDEFNFEDTPNEPPFDCKSCICFEYPDLSKKVNKNRAREKKKEWFKKIKGTLGTGGKLLYLNGQPVGFCQYAPPHLLPLSKAFSEGCPPPSDDAIYISCVRILKEHRRKGLATALLKNVIDDLKKKDVKAVETFAGKDINLDDFPSGPMELYLKLGFKIARRHKNYPLMRLELK
jgi:ribosomal protein S18 acetylase RimI-like enzyme